MIEVRPALPEDEREVSEVFAEAWAHLARSVLGLAQAPEVGQSPIGASLVALEGEAIVGFCSVRDDVLNRLYVLPSHHGLGIGTSLLAQAFSLGARRLWVDEGNLPARSLYERNGWAWDGTVDPGRYWPELVVLRYSIT